MNDELFRVCDGKNKFGQRHRFSASGAFAEIDKCPICSRPMELIKVCTPETRRKRIRSSKVSGSMGFMRSQKIDSLPRFRWFAEAVDINNQDTDRSGDVWTLQDALDLLSKYKEYGDADVDTWFRISNSIGRSLYSVERQLRMVKHCEEELERYYPEESKLKYTSAVRAR